MSHQQPALFVSSTCYDLAQVRENVAEFCATLGMASLVSERGQFPVDPSASTIENCLKVVRERADLFLLIVGGRYGSLAEAGKSVTNLEYLEAKAKGIPKYVFVKREVLALLPVWRANKTADFTTVVDTPKLFEFVEELRTPGDIWVFPFDSATDLISTLRNQLSYLFQDSLQWRRRLQSLDEVALKLDPTTLKHYVERHPNWEFFCLASLLRMRLGALREKKLDVELNLSLGRSIRLEGRDEILDWVKQKISDTGSIIKSVNNLFEKGVPLAVGLPGEAGDIVRIEHFATRVASIQSNLLDWHLDFFRLDAPERFAELLRLVGLMNSEVIDQIETYALNLYDEIDAAVRNPPPSGSATFVLKLTMPDTGDLVREMSVLNA
jgi:hypothetical protein